MIMIYNVIHRQAIHMKFGAMFLTSLAKLVLEAETTICSRIKEIILLFCLKFSAFFI